MVNVHLACSYDKRILPYLYTPLAPPDELRLMGQDGEYVAVHPQLASTLLKLMLCYVNFLCKYILLFLLPIQFNRYRGVFFGHTAEWSGPFPLPSSKAPFLNCYHDVYKVLWYAVLVCCEGSLVLEISILRDPSIWKFPF